MQTLAAAKGKTLDAVLEAVFSKSRVKFLKLYEE